MQQKKIEKWRNCDIIETVLRGSNKRRKEVKMRQKDYYILLGVNKRSTSAEIKTEYRKLAKRFHPDANLNDPEAEDKFKDLNAAYDTLTNKEKRKKYDRMVSKYGYGNVPKVTPEKKKEKAEVKYEVKSSGAVVGELINTILGIGKDAKNVVIATAEDIKKQIDLKREMKKGQNIEATLNISIEEGFLGAEKKLALKTNGGKTSNYAINVPRGIKDGEKIRLAALGKPGKNGGKNGDLIITVKIDQTEKMKLEDKDIVLNQDISYVQSIIGDKLVLRILKEQIDLTIPEGINDKEKIVIADKGYYIDEKTRGKLIVVVNIHKPKELNARERKIYEQLLRVEKQIKK